MPDVSVDWYRGITDFAHGTPAWVHTVAEIGTGGGFVLFAVLFVAVWWRARGLPPRVMGLALLAPVAPVAAYLVSEAAKTMIQEERPCRAVAGAVNIAACPPPGDWSLPSNHATIAAAAATALAVAWRALAPLVLPLAALMAFSRVFLGVHYPHDVGVGFLVGSVVAAVVAVALAPVAAGLVARSRRLLVTAPPAQPAPPVVAAGLDTAGV